MCSSGGKIGQTDTALQAAQAATTNTFTQDASTAFANQMTLLGNLQAKLNYIAANPIGYTPEELHAATSSIVGNSAESAKQAIGAAAAYAAAHGGADVGSGVAGEIAGQIGVSAANEKSKNLTALAMQNQELKRQNMWTALSGLSGVGAQLGSAAGTAISGANGAANSATNAGSGALAAQQAGWQDLGGLISGIGGLASAGAGIASDFNQGGGAAQPNMDSVSSVPEGGDLFTPNQEFA